MGDAAVGAGINIGEASLGALIEIKASLGGINERLGKLLALEESYQRLGPTQLRIQGAKVSDANSTTFEIDLGGPAPQRLWEIKRLTIGGITWGTAVTGSAEVYIVPQMPRLNRNLSDLADQSTSLPYKAFYGSDQLVLRNPQRLYVVIVTPAATTQYAVGGGGYDVPDLPTHRVTT